MKTFLYPYKDGSASAKALAQALGVKRIKREGSHFKPSGKTVINWGCSKLPDDIEENVANIINDPPLVKFVTNKLTFFETMGYSDLVVPWTTMEPIVREWLQDGKRVVARTSLTGHSGQGIVILQGSDTPIVEAPLYTLYKPKKYEYRVHCYRPYADIEDCVVFDIQQKKRKTDVPDDDVDWQVRNLKGGFIYARDGVETPPCVTSTALKVFEATGLDFGAVDIIYSSKHDRAYALEVNTAPGLTGTTLEKYVEMFKELIDG